MIRYRIWMNMDYTQYDTVFRWLIHEDDHVDCWYVESYNYFAFLGMSIQRSQLFCSQTKEMQAFDPITFHGH